MQPGLTQLCTEWLHHPSFYTMDAQVLHFVVLIVPTPHSPRCNLLFVNCFRSTLVLHEGLSVGGYSDCGLSKSFVCMRKHAAARWGWEHAPPGQISWKPTWPNCCFWGQMCVLASRLELKCHTWSFHLLCVLMWSDEGGVLEKMKISILVKGLKIEFFFFRYCRESSLVQTC